MRFFARMIVIGFVVFVLYAAAAAFGKPMWGFAAALALLLVVHGARFWRAKRSLARRAEGWSAAQAVPDARRRAIEELRKVLARDAGGDAGTRAKLTILLSELLQVSGDLPGAQEALSALDEGALSPGDRAGMVYARALLALRAGDPETARVVLARVPRVGLDDSVALRLELLDAAAELEVGDAEQALSTSNAVRKRAGDDESLKAEARIVRAAALDALGRRDEAMQIIQSLGPEARAAISAVGLPRARLLVDALETPFRGTA